MFEAFALDVELLEYCLQSLHRLKVILQGWYQVVFHLNQYFLNVENTSLSLCYFFFLSYQLSFVFLSVLFLDTDINPTGNWYEQPFITDFGTISLFSELGDVRFHFFVLCLKVSVPVHNFFLNSPGSHTVDSGFFEHGIVNLFSDFKTTADF